MRSRLRSPFGAVTVAIVLMTACSSSAIRSSDTTSNPNATTSSSIEAPPTASTEAGTTPVATIPAVVVNRVFTAEIRAGLVVAFAIGRRIDRAYVRGVVLTGARYAYDPVGGLEWALVDFTASAAAARAHERLQGAAGDPLVQLQDGPMVLSRHPGARWRFVSDTGGLVCPPRPPALWRIRTDDCPR